MSKISKIRNNGAAFSPSHFLIKSKNGHFEMTSRIIVNVRLIAISIWGLVESTEDKKNTLISVYERQSMVKKCIFMPYPC